MRQAEESSLWDLLVKRFESVPAEEVAAGGVSFDVSRPCTIIGGRNGTGKSRVLKSLSMELGSRGLLIDLHALCEQALAVLRSRSDIEELKEEVELMPIADSRVEDLERIVGRQYERIGWYGLDIVPGDESIASRFMWASDQPIVPYFEATYRGINYDSSTMGLGELSTHLLFWILQQYDQTEELVILLDEPDAYLPPVAASALLARLLRMLSEKQRKWRLIVSTHSADMIADAVEHDAFTILELDATGKVMATRSADDPSAAIMLLTRPPIRSVLYVEDESAYHLARALIASMDAKTARSISIVWGNGFGYMLTLRAHLPVPQRPEIKYALLFDGDQQDNEDIPPSWVSHWPALFLPTDGDPDSLFMTLSGNPQELATRLGRSPAEVSRVIAMLEGKDAHDWVNELGDQFDRALVLPALASLWVDQNEELKLAFQSAVLGAWNKPK